MSWQAVILDFDGVVLESNWARTEAFLALFKDYPKDAVDELIRYHEARGGISRYQKIEHFFTGILKEEITRGRRDALAKRFSDIATGMVLESPFVPGAEEFISRPRPYPVFLVSGSDQEELRFICRERGIADRFKAIYGSPALKKDNVAGLVDAEGFEPPRVAMIGDSRVDMSVALDLGLKFAARAPEGTDWVLPEIGRIDDMRSADAVLAELAAR